MRGHVRSPALDPTGTIGTTAAAIAGARLMKLRAEKIPDIVGITVSMAGSLNVNFGTMTKPLHSGRSAQQGVLAPMLGARGFTASQSALEGRGGYFGAAGGFGSEIFWRTSCSAACSSTSGEGATTALGAIMPEGSASGAGPSQTNCSDQFAIIFLAALPYDCQPDVAATPRQNAITKRKMVRPRDGGLLDTRAFSRSR
jgi:hypothetical protein